MSATSHASLFAWGRDGPGWVRVPTRAPLEVVLDAHLASVSPRCAPPTDATLETFYPLGPDLVALRRPDAVRLLLGPCAVTLDAFSVPFSEKVLLGPGPRLSRLEPGSCAQPTRAWVLGRFHRAILDPAPPRRAFGPSPLPGVAIVADCAEPSERDPREDDPLIASLLRHPAVVLPTLYADPLASEVYRLPVIRARGLYRWLLSRTRRDVFHPARLPEGQPPRSEGQPLIVYGTNPGAWLSLHQLLLGTRP